MPGNLQKVQCGIHTLQIHSDIRPAREREERQATATTQAETEGRWIVLFVKKRSARLRVSKPDLTWACAHISGKQPPQQPSPGDVTVFVQSPDKPSGAVVLL